MQILVRGEDNGMWGSRFAVVQNWYDCGANLDGNIQEVWREDGTSIQAVYVGSLLVPSHSYESPDSLEHVFVWKSSYQDGIMVGVTSRVFGDEIDIRSTMEVSDKPIGRELDGKLHYSSAWLHQPVWQWLMKTI